MSTPPARILTWLQELRDALAEAKLGYWQEKARTFYTQLLAQAERADSDRPALAATRAFLARK